MGNRWFEMYEYRQVIYRMRLGEYDRAIAKAGLMGHRKTAELRQLAKAHGWLEKGPLPGFAKKYGKKRLEAACQQTLLFDNPKCRAVKIILQKGLDQEPCELSTFDRLAEAYTGKERFYRNITTLLIQ
jgi:hypothetical protein